MTRRQVVLLPLTAYAQSRFPGVAYRDYPACLPQYLTSLAGAARLKREAALSKLTTAESIHARQHWARATLLELIGTLPQRTDLNAKVVGAFERQGYRVERIVYESRPKLYIAANLYVPTQGQPPFPGVLFQLGHSANGKAYDSYQRACQGLVKLGFLVLAFDPMGQGERIYYPDATGIRTRLSSADDEHSTPGRQMLLVGTTCSQFQVWDAMRSLDYLASHPLVDATKLASAGQSGGATLTMLLAALDDRVRVAAVMSGNTENVAVTNFIPPGSTDDAEQDFVGSGPLGFDRWDLLYPFAPKPLLISVSDKDYFGTYSPNYVSDSWQEYTRLKQVYKLLGKTDLLGWSDTPLPHGLSYDSRLHMYNWLSRHLKNAPEPVREEPSTAPEADDKLWVSKTGNVTRDFGGETPASITKQRVADSMPGAPAPDALVRLLRLEDGGKPGLTLLKQIPAERGVGVAAADIPSTGNVSLPAWLFYLKQELHEQERPDIFTRSGKPIILLLHPGGRNRDWHEGGLCHVLAKQGFTVCAADVRGIGDLAPQFGRGAPGYAREHQDQENYAWSSLILGRPMLGQRVADILAITRSLTQQYGRRMEIVISALRDMTMPALFAAYLDRSIRGLYLARSLISYRSLIETDDYRYPFANFLPGILETTDIPDMLTAMPGTRVVIAGATDAKGEIVPLDKVRQTYRAALNGGHIELKESSDWSAESIMAFASPQ